METSTYHDLRLSQIDTSDFLIAVSESGEAYEFGSPFTFVNRKGQTVLPVAGYEATFTDTLKTFAIVIDSTSRMVGIDRGGRLLFEVYRFDNGPDYVEEGLFRVVRSGKIGFANTYGEIVIPCQFECAYPFEGGRAKVAKSCTAVQEGEHSRWESDSWYYIDRSGKRVQ